MCGCTINTKCFHHSSMEERKEYYKNMLGDYMEKNETPHPESIDPPWFQELVRRAYERELRRNMQFNQTPDEASERAMWYIFDLRNNLTDLYQAGAPGQGEDFYS